MHFSTIAISAIAVASSTLASPATVGVSRAVAGESPCSVGAKYCGWYLNQNLGWNPRTVIQYAMYECKGSFNAVPVDYCLVGAGCLGPQAHCST